MIYDYICQNHMDNDCWGCPYKEKVGRNTTCRDWIAGNVEEAARLADKYVRNGMCIIDRNNPPFVGRLYDGRYQQICPVCFDVHVLKEKDIFVDEYIGKRAYTCPKCKTINTLKKQKNKITEAVNA